MAKILALSEAFWWAIRTRVDPALAEHGFRRLQRSPWHRPVYLNGSRYLVIWVHLESLEEPRWLTVTLGSGPRAVRAGPEEFLEEDDLPCRYPIGSAADVPRAVDALLGDLDARAAEFLSGEGRWRPGPAPVHPVRIGA